MSDLQELSDAEVAAIHLGRVYLANSNGENDMEVFRAIKVLDELLEAYGYKFGEKPEAQVL